MGAINGILMGVYAVVYDRHCNVCLSLNVDSTIIPDS